MQYFKNTELAKLYHVSEKSVRNWIQSARDGKLDLKLHKENDRDFVANTTKNTAIIEQLVEKGRKYKNTRGFKVVSPRKEFYEIYDQKKIIDILSNLYIHHESPLQYCYLNGGAEDWDKYSIKCMNEAAPNLLNATISLINQSANNMDDLMAGYSKINVVDIGPGNAFAIRQTLERLLEQGRLGRYIAIDISKDMLDIAENNIRSWFGDSVAFEAHIRDISNERFGDLLEEGFVNKEVANLVFFLGGTLSNFRAPEQILQTINNSMGADDLLVCCGDLDTPTTRRYFDFTTSMRQKIPELDGQIIHLLGIDESLYDVEWSFDEKEQARTLCILPKVDLSIKFELHGETRYVELRKQEPVLLRRHRHYDFPALISLFSRCDFNMILAAAPLNQNHYLMAVKIKIEHH